jgi:hypothetical protein
VAEALLEGGAGRWTRFGGGGGGDTTTGFLTGGGSGAAQATSAAQPSTAKTVLNLFFWPDIPFPLQQNAPLS